MDQDRQINFTLMILYTCAVFWIFYTCAVELYLQQQISREFMRPWYGFVIDYFKENKFNLIIMISQVFNAGVLIVWLHWPALSVRTLVFPGSQCTSQN